MNRTQSNRFVLSLARLPQLKADLTNFEGRLLLKRLFSLI